MSQPMNQITTKNNKTVTIKGEMLTISHYKEPLKAVEKGKGYGYYGALLSTVDGEKIQCHICGKLYQALHAHVKATHNMSAHKYKEKFGLAYLTSLVSEKQREKNKMVFLNWMKSLTPEQKEAWFKRRQEDVKKSRGKRKHGQPKLQLESYNKRGTCPDQVLAKIQEVVDKLGRVPSLYEFVAECGTQRYKHLIFKIFGSWKNALKMLNMKPKDPNKGGFKKYTDEELIEYLRIYTEAHRQMPTYSDFKRSLLPGYEIYLNRFGSMEEARKIAGLYDIVSPPKPTNRKPKTYAPHTFNIRGRGKYGIPITSSP